LGRLASAALVTGGAPAVSPLAAAPVAGVVPVVESSAASPPGSSPAATLERALASVVSVTAFWTVAPGPLAVVAPGSLAGTVVTAGAAAAGATSSVFGFRNSM
jgi:hypothetical protein